MKTYDKKSDGIAYKDHTWMVAGYIDDFIQTDTEGKITTYFFEDNTGYVDKERNIVRIFYDHPPKTEFYPWFTVDVDKGEIVYNPLEEAEACASFSTSRIMSMDIDVIAATSKNVDNLYEEDMQSDLKNAASAYIPEIKDQDDFLKKIVKMMLLEKGVNARRYKQVVDKPYLISNLIQGLDSTTKMNPNTFGIWMGLGCCDFKIILEDNGADPKYPLKNRIIYDSATNRMQVENEGGEGDEKKTYALSAQQYSD